MKPVTMVNDDSDVISIIRLNGFDHEHIARQAEAHSPGAAAVQFVEEKVHWFIMYFRGFPDPTDNGWQALGFDRNQVSPELIAATIYRSLVGFGMKPSSLQTLNKSPNVGESE